MLTLQIIYLLQLSFMIMALYGAYKYLMIVSHAKCYNIFIKVMIKQGQIIQDSPKLHKKDPRPQPRTPQQQSEFTSSLLSDLNSANPILPPGVHRDYHEIHSLRYKHLIQKSKLNKTTFPQVKARNWLNQTQGNITLNKFNNNHHLFVQGEIEEELSEFREILEGKIPVYTRIDNKKYNRIDKDQMAYFSSLFFNYKKQEIKSRKNPIFQYLPRIYKQMKAPDKVTDVLNFNSAFQSGNLFCALRCPEQYLPTYELYMQNDINTKGCTQWFYFSIWADRRIKIRLKIMNFYKPTSLYMSGMKVLVSTDQVEWKRVGTAIKYNRVSLRDGKQSYCLQFIYEIQQSHKQHFFSYGYPYTYSHLENILGVLSQSALYPRVTAKSILCQTFLGNNVHVLTISNNLKSKTTKPMIYILGRQHPGETPTSFIVEGLIKTILSSRIQMEELRQNFIIKIVPMVNIDGVVNGNYRSNFSGNDVNRQWQQPSRRYHPQIYTLKQQILSNKRNVHFFLDIHAHSRKMNSFFYGSKGLSTDSKLYPFVCSKLNKNISFSQCSFVDDASKKTTARVVLQNQANIKRSLTFEASFYGYQDEVKKTRSHFKQEDLRNLGESLALGLYYSEIGAVKYLAKNQADQQKTKKQQIENGRNSVSCHLGQQLKKPKKSEIYAKIEKNCARIIQKWKKQIQKQKKLQDDVISQGSSLDPEHFQLSNLEQQKITQMNEEAHKQLNGNNNPQQKVPYLSARNNPTTIEQERTENEEENNNIRKEQEDKDYQKQMKNEEEQKKYSFFPIQSNLRNSLVVKKLESQLQMQRTHRRYQSFRTQKQRQQEQGSNRSSKLKNQIIEGKRFKSIDVQQKQGHNYRNNIIEMKKALKYFIQNKSYDYKSTDYDDYKAYMKSTTNGTTLVFTDKQSIARIKKKYARI